jgi:hypothetical protein
MHRRRIAVSHRQFQSCSSKCPYMIVFSSVGTQSDTGPRRSVWTCSQHTQHKLQGACSSLGALLALAIYSSRIDGAQTGFQSLEVASIGLQILRPWCMLGSAHGDRATGGASTRARSSHRALQAQTSRDIHPDIEIHYHVTIPRLARDVQLLVLLGVPTARSPCAGSTSSRPAGPGVPPLAPTTQLLFAHLPPRLVPSSTPHNHNPLQPPSRSPDAPSWQPCIFMRLIDDARLLGASHPARASAHALHALCLAWCPPGNQAPGSACNGSTEALGQGCETQHSFRS